MFRHKARYPLRKILLKVKHKCASEQILHWFSDRVESEVRHLRRMMRVAFRDGADMGSATVEMVAC